MVQRPDHLRTNEHDFRHFHMTLKTVWSVERHRPRRVGSTHCLCEGLCLEVCDVPAINLLTIVSVFPSRQRIGTADEEGNGGPIRATLLSNRAATPVKVLDSFDVVYPTDLAISRVA